MGIGKAGEWRSPELNVIERWVFETALKMEMLPCATSALARILTFSTTGADSMAMPCGRR
jgi:hypothetical protein